MGGLSKSKATGETSPYFATSFVEVMFHNNPHTVDLVRAVANKHEHGQAQTQEPKRIRSSPLRRDC